MQSHFPASTAKAGSTHNIMSTNNDLTVEEEICDQKVNKTRIASKRMAERCHFDSGKLQERMAEMSGEFERFWQELAGQNRRMFDQKAFIEFIHEADEVAECIHSQMAVAASEDYGKDVSLVKRLIKTFDSFLSGVRVLAKEERVGPVREQAARLAAEQNINQQKIAERTEETVQLWDDLQELATAFSEALSGAKQVHMFSYKSPHKGKSSGDCPAGKSYTVASRRSKTSSTRITSVFFRNCLVGGQG